ncbi:MAG: hypothetical protein CME62_03555 [Halobacteriovoraceae bacterium]|nr:hypothetical protein [Halobacteriovoraceae bacterium]|tara:strand:- start:26073 stop:27095 length:1023 start_codon:yes stop_codon:yes gene_type:complete
MKILVLLTIVFSLFSCNEKDGYVYFDDPPPRQYYKRSFDPSLFKADNKVDILWVVDNSGSMSSIQANIVKNAGLFMENFQNDQLLEWKMGVMSTDVDEDPYLGFDTPFDFDTINPIKVFTDEFKKLGTNGAYDEYVFRNVHRAFDYVIPRTDPRLPAQYQFFRNNAHFVVIMVTDEPPQSYKLDDTLYEPIPFLNTMSRLIAGDKILRFYGAIAAKDLENCSESWSYTGSRFETVVNDTGGFTISACLPDFGKGLAEIGKDIASIPSQPRLLLGDQPKPETIKVTYKGVELQGGTRDDKAYWYYDKHFNRINFYNIDFIPDGDLTEIEVSFEIEDGVDRS